MNRTHSTENQHLPRWLRMGLSVSGYVAFLAFLAMVLRAWHMVNNGKGLNTYRTVWLAEDSAIGFLVFTAVFFIALVIAVGLRWRQKRQEQREWKSLQRKSGHE